MIERKVIDMKGVVKSKKSDLLLIRGKSNLLQQCYTKMRKCKLLTNLRWM